MYVPPAFAEDDPAILRQMMEQARLATLVTLGPQGMEATPLPLLVQTAPDGRMQLAGHIARANPQWRHFDRRVPALALFQGPDAYVTPSWYAAKVETGKVVPTWNYTAVHAYGSLRILEDRAEILDIVRRQTDRHEADRDRPWSLDDAPADFLLAMTTGIVGVVLTVERLEGKRKLSQNRPGDDQARIKTGLALSGDHRDRALSKLMP